MLFVQFFKIKLRNDAEIIGKAEYRAGRFGSSNTTWQIFYTFKNEKLQWKHLANVSFESDILHKILTYFSDITDIVQLD